MIDSARMYGNEAQVGKALRESGVPRNEVFIVSKIASNEHGYESTLAAVDNSLVNFGVGVSCSARPLIFTPNQR